MSLENLKSVAAALERRGFATQVYATGAEAAAFVLKAAESASTIGMGGAETIKQIGVVEALTAAGRTLVRQTPCAATGICADCDSPDRICKVTAIMDRKPTGTQATVVLVDDDLGF